MDENGNQVYYESGKMQGKPKFAVKHHRRKENLSLYLIDKPRTPAERQQNKETLELTSKIRAEREQEFKESMLGYRLKKDRTVNFLDYYQAYINSYTKKDIRMVQIALNRFKDFLKILRKDVLSPEEIQKLIACHYDNENPTVRRAFIFCLYCGLRFCDVKDLTYKNVDYANRLLKFEQSKTKG